MQTDAARLGCNEGTLDMPGSNTHGRVAIFNSRPDFIEALRVALETHGNSLRLLK